MLDRSLDMRCYSSVPWMLLPSTAPKQQLIPESVMRAAPILVSLFSLVLAACGQSNGSEKKSGPPGMGFPPPEVSVATVQAQSLPLVYEYPGQTAGSRDVEVRARVPGIILKRNFTEGMPVKEGQSLYTIDPAAFEAAAARAQADVVAAQARYEQAKRSAAGMKPLYAEMAVSQKQNDDDISAEESGAADVKAAKARLVEARLNLEYTKVEAPVAGTTTRALPSEGTLVSGPNVLLTSVVQTDPMWVNFGIPDNDQARIQKEAQSGRLSIPKQFEVELRLADGSVYPSKGRLNFSDVRIAPATGTREARAEVPNAQGALRPGQFVRVILKGATIPNAVTIPQRAVLEGPQGKFVYLVNDKSQAEARPVEAGEWSGDSWVITSGLNAGERD